MQTKYIFSGVLRACCYCCYLRIRWHCLSVRAKGTVQRFISFSHALHTYILPKPFWIRIEFVVLQNCCMFAHFPRSQARSGKDVIESGYFLFHQTYITIYYHVSLGLILWFTIYCWHLRCNLMNNLSRHKSGGAGTLSCFIQQLRSV